MWTCWQGLGRGSCFLYGVSAIQIHCHIYTLSACVLPVLLWCDMDPCSRHLIPLAVLLSHNNKTAFPPQVLSSISLAGAGFGWMGGSHWPPKTFSQRRFKGMQFPLSPFKPLSTILWTQVSSLQWSSLPQLCPINSIWTNVLCSLIGTQNYMRRRRSGSVWCWDIRWVNNQQRGAESQS